MAETEGLQPLTGDDLLTWSALATVLEWLPQALDATLSDFDLTHFEYGVLFALAHAPDRALRMSALAGYANSSLSRLSRAVTRLERRGWAQRRPDPADGRSTVAALTEGGLETFERATPAHERTVRQLVLQPLTVPQRDQLRAISVRLQRAVREQGGWQPPPLA